MLKVTRRKLMTAAAGLAVLPLPASATNSNRIVAKGRVLEVKGKAANVLAAEVNGKLGGLITRFGEPFRVTVENTLQEETLIHWHGLTPPSGFDGVPMLSAAALKPGESVDYSWDNRRTGTHWLHSHVGLQEQRLLAAPLIVHEAGEALVDEQEHVVMLHDFTFRDPQEILAELQGGGGLHASHSGHGGHMNHGTGHGDGGGMMMNMANDVAFDAMLANDRTADDPEVVRAEKGGRFRLRIINGAAATNFWIDLGAAEGELVAVDGNAVHPLKGSRFPLAIAQRADIRLSLPQGSGSWPIRFVAEGTTQQAAIILAAGSASISKLVEPQTPAELLTLDLEERLRAVAGQPDNPVSRSEMLMLTGGGADYVWGFNGKASMHDVIFTVKEGERYEIMMHNMTGMAHPMHLHGHYFRVVGINGKRFKGALRDTVLVPADSLVTIQFDADNPGTWAFHCHHLYHMNAGMMGAIAYASPA